MFDNMSLSFNLSKSRAIFHVLPLSDHRHLWSVWQRKRNTPQRDQLNDSNLQRHLVFLNDSSLSKKCQKHHNILNFLCNNLEHPAHDEDKYMKRKWFKSSRCQWTRKDFRILFDRAIFYLLFVHLEKNGKDQSSSLLSKIWLRNSVGTTILIIFDLSQKYGFVQHKKCTVTIHFNSVWRHSDHFSKSQKHILTILVISKCNLGLSNFTIKIINQNSSVFEDWRNPKDNWMRRILELINMINRDASSRGKFDAEIQNFPHNEERACVLKDRHVGNTFLKSSIQITKRKISSSRQSKSI